MWIKDGLATNDSSTNPLRGYKAFGPVTPPFYKPVKQIKNYFPMLLHMFARRFFSHYHKVIQKPLQVYTDGSYIESVKKGGMGIYFPNNEFTSLSIPYVNPVPPTNQRCELLAIKYALIIHSQYFSSKPLHLYTDSKYAIECLTMYNYLWSKNGWLKTNGQSVKNQDLLKPMVSHLSEVTNVQFNYVKAHTNNWDIHSLNNNVADAYARRGVMAKSPMNVIDLLDV